jgi:hypothetical protein
VSGRSGEAEQFEKLPHPFSFDSADGLRGLPRHTGRRQARTKQVDQ